ncbi:hypothetical protein LPB144_00885 [Christiangramia salexigens]|uniref:Uncharacterized protein n=1 Tax=Christiangramia salexigens TaxID=1913577 RepID=A0A1L3J1P7_9FLAO|nr:hypothetical protein LPB144_00885 [Christiangramia salexigens]
MHYNTLFIIGGLIIVAFCILWLFLIRDNKKQKRIIGDIKEDCVKNNKAQTGDNKSPEFK